MAFDRPIEADRVDDLGLFSAFIRAPIVGTLMWVLGGSQAMEEEQKEKKLLDSADTDGASTKDDPTSSTSQGNRYALNMEQSGGRLKKTAPRLIGSDISDFGECAMQAEQASCLQKAPSDLDKNRNALRKTRKMSWSDESGQNLVEYIDESASAYQQSKMRTMSSANGPAKPVKSAMRRTSSISEDASDLGKGSNSSMRYLPKGLGGAHKGLVLPTRPDAPGIPSGHHSPEWGWYINTTPPTPEMYHSNYSSNSKKLASKETARRSAVAPSDAPMPASASPAFTSNLKGSAKTAMGWPSVPL